MHGSSFALLEIDAQRCRIGLWHPESSRPKETAAEGPAFQALDTLEPVLALDEQGAWQLGDLALGQRLRRPEACVMDLCGDPEVESGMALDRGRATRWPFAPRVLRADGSVGWEIQSRVYPRAWLWSKVLLFAREKAEAAAQCEIRALAVIAGRGVSPAMRRDLEQAGALARVQTLWWVDRSIALGYVLAQGDEGFDFLGAAHNVGEDAGVHGEESAEQAEDPLSRINAMLGMGEPDTPNQARLSQVEFAAPGDAGSAKQDAKSGPVDGSETSEREQERGETSDEDPAELASEELASEEVASEEVALSQHWVWVADAHCLELTKIQVQPELEILSRELLPTGSRLLWLDALVASLNDELKDSKGIELAADSLAMVRVWDACSKLMHGLNESAQVQLHLPHLCVHGDSSFHYDQTWTRRRMDALVGDTVAQLKEQCSQQEEPVQWSRYGSGSETPAWTRVATHCEPLRRKDAKMDSLSALIGASRWIQERQGEGERRLVPDRMVGELIWEHPSGLQTRCACHGQSLPLREDLQLETEGLAEDDERPWSVLLELPVSREDDQEHSLPRYEVARVEIRDVHKDGRVRVEVQRQGKIVVSRSPAAKNAGAQDLRVLPCGMSEAQVLSAQAQQSKHDALRFVQMRGEAMRGTLAHHCSHLSQVIADKGDRMDDLLSTRIVEWVAQAKEHLNPDAMAQDWTTRLHQMEPVHAALLALAETLTAPQRKALALALEPLPELMQAEAEAQDVVNDPPWWPVERRTEETPQVANPDQIDEALATAAMAQAEATLSGEDLPVGNQ